MDSFTEVFHLFGGWGRRGQRGRGWAPVSGESGPGHTDQSGPGHTDQSSLTDMLKDIH